MLESLSRVFHLRAVWFLLAFAPLGGANEAARAQDFEKDRPNNWHHWRGPDANGAAPKADPPVSWDAATNIKWKAKLPGRGSATPIVWGNNVFLVAAIKTDRVATGDELPRFESNLERRTKASTHFHRFEVLCFDRTTGDLRWRRTAAERVPHEGHHESHSYAAGSPTTDGRSLFVSFGSFGIYCYDFDGNLRWQRDLGRLVTRLGWGEAVTPVVQGDNLILNWDQEENAALIVLDARTGETRWKKERDEKSSWNTPCVVEHKGTFQIIVNGTNRVRSYDLAKGCLLWEFGGMSVNAIPSIVAAEGVAYCMSGYQTSAAMAVSLDRRGELTNDEFLWRVNKGTPYVPSPLLIGDRLLFTQANQPLLTVLDRETGRVVLDRERLPSAGQYYASPIAAAGRIYLVNREGITLVLKQGDQLEVLATNALNDPIDASPVAVGKQLFLRSEKFLYCIEEK